MPGDVLSGLDPDVGQAGLGDDVGVQASDGHQAAQVAALVVGLVVLVQAHLGGRPALQVARAVDGAEALAVGCNRGEKGGLRRGGPEPGAIHALRGVLGNSYGSVNWKKTGSRL